MVARLTLAKSEITPRSPRRGARHSRRRADDHARARALRRTYEDEAAYGGVVAATALPKATPDERASAHEFRDATGPRRSHSLERPYMQPNLPSSSPCSRRARSNSSNAQLASDLGCAAEFAQAALAAAALNVRVNHKYLKDRVAIAARRTRTRALRKREVAPLVKRYALKCARRLAL